MTAKQKVKQATEAGILAPTVDTVAQKKNHAALLSRILANSKTLKTSHAETHAIALDVLQHVETYREVSLANRQVSELPSAGRKTALIKWYQAHGKMKWNFEKKAFIFKSDFATKIEEAKEKPYWEFVPEKEFTPYDLEKDFASFLKRAANKAEEDERNKVDPVLLAKLQALKEAVTAAA
jgi:hypothetical protein